MDRIPHIGPTKGKAVEQWMAYSGMAAAFLAVAKESKGQIFYTDLDPDVVLENDEFPIDFDGDGTTDITFFHQSTALEDFSIGFAFFDGEVIGSIVDTYYVYGDVLLFGDPVGPTNPNWQIAPQYYGYLGNVVTYYGYTYYANGPWLGETGYLGVRFIGIDGQFRYAWVHLSVDEEASSIVLLGYAFENAPNTAIAAGNIGNVGLSPLARSINAINVYPNPVTEQARVDVAVDKAGSYDLRLFNALGQTVLERRIALQSGEQQVDLDVQHLARGSYVLELRNAEQVLQRKLTKN